MIYSLFTNKVKKSQINNRAQKTQMNFQFYSNQQYLFKGQQSFINNNNCISLENTDQIELDLILKRKNFTVAVRIKPQNSNSKCLPITIIKQSDTSQQLKIDSSQQKLSYNSYSLSNARKLIFDRVFQSKSENEQIFNQLIYKKLHLLKKGVNLSLMAYGATNSGKTFTIFGKNQNQNQQQTYITHGLAVKTFTKVFEMLSSDHSLNFSFLQIYNENIYDLLNSNSQSKPLTVMEDYDGNTNINGLQRIPISSIDQLQTLIFQGNNARISSSNNQNMHSSRSHAFMQLEIKNLKTRQRTKLVIVDLAGSEKYITNNIINSNKLINPNNSSNLLKQGSNINKSLLSLGNCIKSLQQNQSHIPYRDSKLTRLLKQNLNGYAHNIMIACINQKASNLEQNLNSLNYALKAMKIEKQIQRKVQSQQLSEYFCSNCNQKLTYSLIKEINKHQEHNKRVKTRQSQSLSVSPIAKHSNDRIIFKSNKVGLSARLNVLVENIIDQKFDQTMMGLSNSKSLNSIAQVIFDLKNQLKRQIKKIYSKNNRTPCAIKDENSHGKVSQFQTTLQSLDVSSFEMDLSQQKIKNQKKLKINLSKPKKHLQQTATSSLYNKSSLDATLQQNDYKKEQFSNNSNYQNHIKIEQDQISNNDLHSFRSLTVNILTDGDKILDQRKQMLQQLSQNKLRNRSITNGLVSNLSKFKSIQNSLKSKNIQKFMQKNSLSNNQAKIKYSQFIKIQDQQNQNRSIEPFDINDMSILLNSTAIAPKMKRDDQQNGLNSTLWNHIHIKNIQSPDKLFQKKDPINFTQTDTNYIQPNMKIPHFNRIMRY